jgi:ligand-binding sensor domain-containing protein
VIREDPKNPKILYVGTDWGVYISIDGGKRYQTLGAGLPSTFISDLFVHPRDQMLIIATHGRGMYALDVKPIQAKFSVRRDLF